MLLQAGDGHPEITRDGKDKHAAIREIDTDEADHICLFDLVDTQTQDKHGFSLATYSRGRRGVQRVFFRFAVVINLRSGCRCCEISGGHGSADRGERGKGLQQLASELR